MDRLTVSGLERAWECPASCAIPVQVHSSGVSAARGSEIHDYAESVLSGYETADVALSKVSLEHRQTCADIDWGKLVGDIHTPSIRCEVAYAVDAATGHVRELGVGLKRAYPETGPSEIHGTNDVEGVTSGDVVVDGVHVSAGTPIVQDIKTGQPVTRAAENWQIRFHAYVQYIRTGALFVVGRLAYIAEDGSVTLDSHVFDAFELDDFPAQLRALFARIEKAATEVRGGLVVVSEGEHCRWCPSFASCPAKVQLVRAMLPALTELDGEIRADCTSPLTPARAGEIWARFKELQPMVKRIDDALKEYVRAHPGEVFLPDGKVIQEIPMGRTNVNGERALALAKAYGATDEELQGCMQRASWTQLRATRPKKPGGRAA